MGSLCLACEGHILGLVGNQPNVAAVRRGREGCCGGAAAAATTDMTRPSWEASLLPSLPPSSLLVTCANAMQYYQSQLGASLQTEGMHWIIIISSLCYFYLIMQSLKATAQHK